LAAHAQHPLQRKTNLQDPIVRAWFAEEKQTCWNPGGVRSGCRHGEAGHMQVVESKVEVGLVYSVTSWKDRLW
jgi:hypothetical protein